MKTYLSIFCLVLCICMGTAFSRTMPRKKATTTSGRVSSRQTSKIEEPTSPTDTVTLYAAVKKDGKWGFIDKKRNLVIPPKYDDVHRFSEGLASVKIGSKWGCIDPQGNMVIPAQYDSIRTFSDGMAIVYLNGKYGVVNKKGETIAKPKYAYIKQYSNGAAPISDGINWDLGYIDKNGKLLIPHTQEKIYYIPNRYEGLIPIERNSKYGFVDSNGKLVIPPKFDEVRGFSEGLAVVSTGDKYGVIDKQGNMVVPAKYDYIGDFSNGLAKVTIYDENGGYLGGGKSMMRGWVGIIDSCGNIQIPIKFNDIGEFSEGLAYFIQTLGDVYHYGFIDDKGNIKIDLGKHSYRYNAYPKFSEGLACVSKNNKEGFINKKGVMVVPAIYDRVGHFSDGRACVKKGSKWGAIDKKGRMVIPAIYDEIGNFMGGVADYRQGNKKGLIDKNGKVITLSLPWDVDYRFHNIYETNTFWWNSIE